MFLFCCRQICFLRSVWQVILSVGRKFEYSNMQKYKHHMSKLDVALKWVSIDRFKDKSLCLTSFIKSIIVIFFPKTPTWLWRTTVQLHKLSEEKCFCSYNQFLVHHAEFLLHLNNKADIYSLYYILNAYWNLWLVSWLYQNQCFPQKLQWKHCFHIAPVTWSTSVFLYINI